MVRCRGGGGKHKKRLEKKLLILEKLLNINSC